MQFFLALERVWQKKHVKEGRVLGGYGASCIEVYARCMEKCTRTQHFRG